MLFVSILPRRCKAAFCDAFLPLLDGYVAGGSSLPEALAVLLEGADPSDCLWAKQTANTPKAPFARVGLLDNIYTSSVFL